MTKNFRSMSEKKVRNFEVHIFPQNWSKGQLECIILIPQRPFFLKIRKEVKTHHFQESICYPKSYSGKKCSSHYFAASFSVSCQNNFGRSLERFTKLSSFQNKNCSPISILWTSRIKFSQPCGNFFARRPTFFRSNSGWTDEFKNFSREISCPKP